MNVFTDWFKNDTQKLLDKEAELAKLSDELATSKDAKVNEVRAELARERGTLLSQAARK